MKIDWREIIRFGIVGIVATAIHYGVYVACQLFLNANIAYTIGWIVSLGCNFYLSSRFTFRREMSAYRAGGFIGSHIVNYLMHMGLFNLFLYLGIGQVIAPLLVYCIVIPINYLLVRFVFRKLP
jgi:putative flippase GtrA